MQQDELRLIGKVKEAHGLRGEVYFLVFSGELEWLPRLKEVHLSFDEGKNLKAYELEKAKAHKAGFIARLKGLEDRNQAEAHKGALAYIPAELLRSAPGEKIYLSEIEGFEVIEVDQGPLGRIEAFGSNVAQDLIVVRSQSELVTEIPLVEEFIERIDFEGKKLYMRLPLGLVGGGEGE